MIPANGVPYSAKFLSHYRAGQLKRRDKIEAWVWERTADPACDARWRYRPGFRRSPYLRRPSPPGHYIDPSHRKPGGMWGNAKGVNYRRRDRPVYDFMAFLSQRASVPQADGPELRRRHLRRRCMSISLPTKPAFPRREICG